MTKAAILIVLGLGLGALSGCVDAGGPRYVDSRLVNEGPVGARGYRAAPAYRSTVDVSSGPRYSNRDAYRAPSYREPYRDPRYSQRQERYGRDSYGDRGAYRQSDRNRYCADVGYDDPICD